MLRWIMSLAAIVTMVLLATAPALAGSWSANKCGKGNFANNRDFAGLVEFGGRRMYLECHGKGSSRVVFVSGGGDRAETWSKNVEQKRGAKLSTHPSSQCCQLSPKTIGCAPTTVPGLFSWWVEV